MKRPRTNPTEDESLQMKKAARELVDKFGGISQFCVVFKQNYWTVSSFLRRGRVPVELAFHVSESDEFKHMGFTKQYLRPDVLAWKYRNEK